MKYTEDLRAAARNWTARGFIPLAASNKAPAWKGWQTMAPEEHAARVSDAEPEQLGLRMGLQPDGRRLLCIDVDIPGGDEQLRELEDQLGELPRTLEQATGGGGQHLVFTWPADLGEAPRHKLAGKIDLRGERQHIVAAPSQHESGTRYRLVDDIDPVELPRAWALHIVGLKAPKAPALSADAPHQYTGDRGKVAERCRAYVRTCEPAVQGNNGSSAMLRVARIVFHGFGLSEAEGWPVLVDWNRELASPPFDEQKETGPDSLSRKMREAIDTPLPSGLGWTNRGELAERGGRRAATQYHVASVQRATGVKPKQPKSAGTVNSFFDDEPEEQSDVDGGAGYVVGPKERKAGKKKLDAVVARLEKDHRLEPGSPDWSKPVYGAAVKAGKLVGGGSVTDTDATAGLLEAVQRKLGEDWPGCSLKAEQAVASGLEKGQLEEPEVERVARENDKRDRLARLEANASEYSLDPSAGGHELTYHIANDPAASLREETSERLGQEAPDGSDEVFCRNNQLVEVLSGDTFVGRRLGKKADAVDTVVIRPMPVTRVTESLSRRCRFLKANWGEKGVTRDMVLGALRGELQAGEKTRADAIRKAVEMGLVTPCGQPHGLAKALSERGEWATVRPLAGVLRAPSLRPDGTVIQKAGWDEATRFMLKPNGSFQSVPESPTPEDASEALCKLRDLLCDFEFVTEADAFVPIAALMSLLARPAVEGAVPAFLFEASTAGSGKTLLADLVAILATGDELPKASFPKSEEELEKMLGGFALSGSALVGFDNVNVPFQGSSLDKVLTSTLVQLRVLGKSETPTLAWHAVVLATGNNVAVLGDTQRRVLRSRQEPKTERPAERRGFKHPNIKAHVREHRGEYVAAALTVLRAYFVAERPKAERENFGSFDAWQRVISDAILWAGGANVLDCRVNCLADSEDPTTDALRTLLSSLGPAGMSAADLVAKGFDQPLDSFGRPCGEPELPELKEALTALGVRGDRSGRPSAKVVTWTLKRHRGRIVDGRKLHFHADHNGPAWLAVPADHSGREDEKPASRVSMADF